MRYELYCLADPLFYDSPLGPRAERYGYEIAGRPAPAGWRRTTRGDWVVLAPGDDIERPHGRLPRQGWKIHVTAGLDTAEQTLGEVWDYCVPRLVSFKFLRAPHVLHTRNAKYACRESSGKLVTIYTENEARLTSILTELGDLLGGREGPYLLGGLRWANGPLYVRYGGFVPRYCLSDSGGWEPAIEDPDGRLVPNRPTERFAPPPWVPLPAVLRPHIDDASDAPLTALPFLVERVLHQSNGGGVYAAKDTRTGETVVLKEARPHTGLTLDGVDAVARLAHERSIMESLAGLAAVPAVRGYFTVGQRTYLVQDFVEGEPLAQLLRERLPLNDPAAGAEQATEYTKWALRMYGRVEEAVTEVHRRGVVFGDLHPFNVVVRPDDSVALVDFEAAARAGEAAAPDLAHPGFAAPQDRVGFDRDRYALACLRLALFLPLTRLLVLDRGKAAHLAEIIAAHFPVPRDFLDQAVAEIHRPKVGGHGADGDATPVDGAASAWAHGEHPTLVPDTAGWERARASLTAAILASATPERPDRLFPGDIKHFRTGGLNIAYGAAGVLYALDATGAGRYPEYETWLVRQSLHPPQDAHIGFYEGLHGVAYVLEQLCRRDEALKVIDICMGTKWEQFTLDLRSGLAGIALNLRHFAREAGEPSLYDAAVKAADIVADRLGGTDDGVRNGGGAGRSRAGLLDGAAGPALLFIRMFEDSGDQAWLDRAAAALGRDLRHCVPGPDGTLYVNDGRRTVPYLNGGAAGIAIVLDEYLAHRLDGRFSAASAAIRRGVRLPFTMQSGLFNGRAGLLAYLAGRYQQGRAWADPDVALQVRNLAWHALSYQGQLAFPGDQLYRLSMDFATGAAGVLFALGVALHAEPVALPLLGQGFRAADVGRARDPR
jgi:class III lanthionine synthetase